MKTCLTALAILCSAGLATAAELTLAKRGQPAACVIVRPAQASPAQIHAALELQKFTEQMTGVRLPIQTDAEPLPPAAILLGVTRYSATVLGQPPDVRDLGDEGFRLVCKPPHLLVLGSPVRGTLYGVYELLERHGGCRWYTTWHSRIPQRDVWNIPALDDTQRPAFTLREPFWYDMFDGDLAARNKVNGSTMRLGDKHGGKIRFGQGLFVHTFDTLCPPAEFFDTHPEYFSEVQGRRLKHPSQLCLTNPDVVKIVTERLLARIRKDPTAKLFSVSQNDWANFCTCPKCKAIDDREESHSGTMIHFVNQVAEAVAREFPNVWIETLAYQYTRKPPKTLRPRANVVPRLCTIECDFSQPLARSPYSENRKFVQDIQGWTALTDKLFIWDYTTNFHHYIAPFPNVRSLQENVQFFRGQRVVGLFEQGAYQGRHADFAELKAWLLAKWLWNPDLLAEPLLDDFFQGFYGPAAPKIRQYFDELHALYTNPAVKPLRISEDIKTPVLTEAFLTRAQSLWAEAEQAVQDQPAFSYNVRMGALPILFARLARQSAPEEIQVWVTRFPEKFAIPAERRQLASTLWNRFREAKNISLSESADVHRGIVEAWERAAAPPVAHPPQDRAIAEDKALVLTMRGSWGQTVADPRAADGSALKLFNTHYEWAASLPFRRVAFDPGQTYKLRARIRVETAPGREGEAFWAGVYDPQAKRSLAAIFPKTSQVRDEYTWFDVAEWVPRHDHYFWIGPGRFDKSGQSAIKAVYIDQLELIRK